MFSGCSNLREVIASENICSIQQETFYNCSKLTSIIMGDNLINISYGAFYGCSELTSILISDEAYFIASDAFMGCDKLTIYSYIGSFAERVAKDENIPFVLYQEPKLADINGD